MKLKPSFCLIFNKRYDWLDFPDPIRIPALEGVRPDEVSRPLEEATVDDLAFAILGLEAQARKVNRSLGGLRELYDMARKRGALGKTTITEIFGDDGHGEVRQ